MPERAFTPEEANAALAEVRPLVERMVAARSVLLDAQRRQAELVARVASNGGGLTPPDVAAAAAEVQQSTEQLVAVLEELERLGVQVKDLDRGLVDFPARHPESGDLVLLCWHLGEKRVGFWHGLEEGFAGRKPLPF